VLASRATFRLRLDTDNRRWVLFLIAAATLTDFSVAVRARLPSLAIGPAVLLVLPILCLMPSCGVLSALVHSRFLLWTGRWLGGRASARDLHAAQAWSGLPLVACSPIAILPLLLTCLQETSMSPAPGIEQVLAWTDLFVPLAVVVAGMWSAARYAIYLSEAQRFSKSRALMNEIAGGAALLAAAACIVFVAKLIT
jgi:hypothetical protein